MSDHRDIPFLLSALHFAAQKHQDQRRKNKEAPPYVNHLIEVAEILTTVGQVTDVEVLAAAILHDTIEDTATTGEEIGEHFGQNVKAIVLEVTDDKKQTKEKRKRLQVENAPKKSHQAKLVKIADKISNISQLADKPPKGWNLKRRKEYIAWAQEVVKAMGNVHPDLERLFKQKAKENLKKMKGG